MTDVHHDPPIDRANRCRKSRYQCVVANDANHARNAFRPVINLQDSLATEDLVGLAAGDSNPACDVGSRFFQVEWRESAPKRHALLQLPKLGLVQALAELRLTNEDDLEEPLRITLQVC